MPQTKTRITCEANQLIVATHFTLREYCKRVLGFTWDPSSKTWRYPATADYAKAIEAAFQDVPHVEWSAEARGLLSPGRPLANPRLNDHVDPPTLPLPDIPLTRTAPWQHQKVGFWRVVELWQGLPRMED